MKARGIPDRMLLPGLRGRIAVDSVHGSVRVRRWPRKRGPSKSKAQRLMQQRMASAIQLAKFADPTSYAMSMKITAGTGLYPRDWLTHAMFVGVADFVTPEGHYMRHGGYRVSDVIFQGARVEADTAVPVPAGQIVIMPWTTPRIDTAGIWSIAKPTRLTVPEYTQVVELTANVGFLSSQDATWQLEIRKNTTTRVAVVNVGGHTNTRLNVSSGPMDVEAGDYFEAEMFTNIANSISVTSANFFTMTLLQVNTSI